jgi:hypothetical protein
LHRTREFSQITFSFLSGGHKELGVGDRHLAGVPWARRVQAFLFLAKSAAALG